MGKRIIITEEQLLSIVLNESIFEVESIDEFKQELWKICKRLLLAGVAMSSIVSFITKTCDKHNIPHEEVESLIKEISPTEKNVAPKNESDWVLVDDKTIATVYNAKPSQCDGDFGVTATMFRLNLDDVESHKIIAIERTFMSKLGLKRGDVVKIEGTGKWDGVKQIQDVMNKRFAGQHRIDILVPDNITGGKWNNVKLYKLKNSEKELIYKNDMAPQISKKKNEMQMKQKQEQYNKKTQKEMKVKVSNQELHECLVNAISRVINEGKSKSYNKGFEKATKSANREIERETFGDGFQRYDKVHKSKKDYSRKGKNKFNKNTYFDDINEEFNMNSIYDDNIYDDGYEIEAPDISDFDSMKDYDNSGVNTEKKEIIKTDIDKSEERLISDILDSFEEVDYDIIDGTICFLTPKFLKKNVISFLRKNDVEIIK